VELLVVMLAGTTNETCAELPALIESVHDGEQETPEGTPPIATETVPVNPSTAAMEIVAGELVVPSCALIDEGETETEKSGMRTVKRIPLLLHPPTVTITFPVVAPLGTVTVMLVALQAFAVPADMPLNVTVLSPWDVPKLVPVSVTVEPITPEVTLRLVSTGAGTAVIVKLSVAEWLKLPLVPCTVS